MFANVYDASQALASLRNYNLPLNKDNIAKLGIEMVEKADEVPTPHEHANVIDPFIAMHNQIRNILPETQAVLSLLAAHLKDVAGDDVG